MEGESVFQELCTLHGVLIPDLPSHTQHRGETQRPPRPPPGILPLCCHRLFLANPGQAAQNEAWRELPDRNMHWAQHFDQRSQEWTSEWNCLRCNNTVTLEHALLQHIPAQPECPQHGPRTLAIDLRSNERGWVCTRGTNIQTCTPTALPTVTAEATYRPNPAIPHWLRQGPPGHSHLGPTNSWLYVPLLVGRLAPAAEQAWLQDAHGNHEWQQLVQRKLHPSCGNSCAMHRRFYKKLPPTLQETCPPARRPSRPLSPGQQHTCHQQRAFTCRGH